MAVIMQRGNRQLTVARAEVESLLAKGYKEIKSTAPPKRPKLGDKRSLEQEAEEAQD